jgi:hypothetical protein
VTSPHQEASIDIRTTRDIGRAEYARAFLALLERHSALWMPTRFGPYEPLKHSFADDGKDGFENCWLGNKDGLCEDGSVIFKAYRQSGALGMDQVASLLEPNIQ